MSAATWADVGIDLPPGRRSGHVDALCPECSAGRVNSREKCLYIDLDDDWWFCHNCQWTGSLAKGRHQDWRDTPYTPPPPPKPSKPSQLQDTGELAPWVIDFFAARKIGVDVLRRNGIRADVYNGEDVIVTPYRRGGKIITAKYRYRYLSASGKKRHAMEADTEKIPFGLDDCSGATEIIIVEGEPDKLAIEQATGRRAVISPPSGSNIPELARSLMLDVCKDAHVLLAGDMDENGEKMLADLAERIGLDRCSRVTWPCKDANDTLIAFDAATVTACIDDAKPYPVAGIVTIDDISDDIDRLYDEGMPPGASTGWPGFDCHYTVREGQLTIVTGAPGSGKSVWLDALMINLARRGWVFGVCSPEQLPLQRHSADLMATYIGKPFAKGPTERMSVREKDEGKAWLRDRFAFVMPEENTIDAVLARGVVLKRRMGINGFIIDPWTELDHSRPNGMTETEFIHASLKKIRQFALHHACHVWVVAHPTKLRKSDDGTYPVATPYDISGSAGWFNKADNCLSVWRNKADERQPVELHVQKIRFREIGQIGHVYFRYDRVTGRYTEVTNGREY